MKNVPLICAGVAAALLYLVSDGGHSLYSDPSEPQVSSDTSFFAPSNTATVSFSNAEISRDPTSEGLHFSTEIRIYSPTSPPQPAPLHLDTIHIADDGFSLIVEFDSPLLAVDVYLLSSEFAPTPTP